MKQFPAEEFERYVAKVMADEKAPGLSVAVVSGGETAYAKGFGYRDEARGLPVTPNTIFGMASITKSFTALSVMQLVEAGKLSLEDPVQRHLPGFDVPGGGGASITVHHFLSHTSGLPPLPALGYSIRANTKPDPEVATRTAVKAAGKPAAKSTAKAVKKPEKRQDAQSQVPVNTYDELMGYLKKGPFHMLGKPGEYCSYSNDAYGLLGAIIEIASGEPYEDYVKEHVLRPLEMGRSTFSLDWALARSNLTTLYYKDEDQQIKGSSNWQVAPPYLACGWLKSTALDMANYVRMYAGGGTFKGRRLASAESVAKMAGRHHVYSRDRWYGYGLSVRPEYHGVTLVEHSGGLKGVNTNMGFVPEAGVGAVALCNLSGGPAGRVWLAAINLMLGLPVDTPRSEYRKDPWPAADLPRLTGRFLSGEGSETVLSAEDGKLIATTGKEKREVLKDSDGLGVLTVNGVDTEMRFYLGEDRKVWAVGFGGRVIRKTAESP